MNWIWIGVIISLILIELVSLNFTAIWFVISAVVSYTLLKCNQNYIVQVLVFLILGSLFILIIRPKVIAILLKLRDKFINKIVSKHSFFNYLIPKHLRIYSKKENIKNIQQDNKKNEIKGNNTNIKKKNNKKSKKKNKRKRK